MVIAENYPQTGIFPAVYVCREAELWARALGGMSDKCFWYVS